MELIDNILGNYAFEHSEDYKVLMNLAKLKQAVDEQNVVGGNELKKYTVEKNLDDTKKEIEALLKSIFGKAKYEKQGNDVYYFYPAHSYAELEDYYKCVTVMARKLTNNKTVVIVNYNNDGITTIDWKHRPLQMVYDKMVACIPPALNILDV